MELMHLLHLNCKSALQLLFIIKTLFMLPDKIMQSDILDIIFENRNKTYGAYALRKSYNKTLAAAISITLFIAMIFSVFQFMHHGTQRDKTIQVIIPPDNIFTNIDPVKPKPETPKPQQVATHLNQITNSSPVIVKDKESTKMPTIADLTKNIIGDANIIGKGDVDVIQAPQTNEGSGSAQAQPVVEAKPDDKPLNWAQIMPEYPGGVQALIKFMQKNLRQPDDLQAGEKIIIMASFVVNKNGQIEQVKIINDGRNDLNKEVERVINKMPLWKPGMQNGNTVAVYFSLPVTFISEEE